MRIISTALLFIFAIQFYSVSAQGNQDKKAEKLLKDVSKKYKGYKTLQVQFSIIQKNQQQVASPAQKGTITMRGEAFRLELSSQAIYCDGKTIWTYMQDVKEVHVNTYKPGDEDITPSKIFSLYGKDFLYRSAGDVSEGGRKLSVVELPPKKKTSSYFLIKVKIDAVKSEIVSAEIKEKNGTSTTYGLQNQKTNIPLAADYFTFTPSSHKGVQVVDLR